MFFKSEAHKQRFLTAIQEIGKVYEEGKLSQEYGSALYILTSSTGLWQKASDYVSRDGINIEAMLKDVDLSGGYSVLVMLAGNLFNDQTHCDAIELMRLDEWNFKVALFALELRHYSYSIDDFFTRLI